MVSTARRNDASMKAHPFVVEKEKPSAVRGHYTHHELYGLPKEESESAQQSALKKP